jgi:hypothetical protein
MRILISVIGLMVAISGCVEAPAPRTEASVPRSEAPNLPAHEPPHAASAVDVDSEVAGHRQHGISRLTVQIAGNPGRHEPDVGEINYPFLFDVFDELG